MESYILTHKGMDFLYFKSESGPDRELLRSIGPDGDETDLMAIPLLSVIEAIKKGKE